MVDVAGAVETVAPEPSELPARVTAVTVAVWAFAPPAAVSTAVEVVPGTCAVVPSSRATV